MITKAQAAAIANAKVAELAKAAGDQFEILDDQTKQVDRGWVFFFNSADFVRTRDPVDALAGNAPILVFKDGRVEQLSTALPLEESLKQV
jgi:Immunity protein 35